MGSEDGMCSKRAAFDAARVLEAWDTIGTNEKTFVFSFCSIQSTNDSLLRGSPAG